MDESQRREFMIVASAIGPGIFRRNGYSLREFLTEYVSDGDTAKDVAVKIFEYFCLDDNDRFNNFLPGVQLAIGFLDAVEGVLGERERTQALKDLRNLLAAGNKAAIRQWVNSNYP